MSGTKHFVLQELASGVHAAIASDGGWAICNSGIVDLGDRLLVFDTFVNQRVAADLRAEVERKTGKKVELVVNSHWHGDHVRGNLAFPGAEIISTSKTLEVMSRMKARSESPTEVEKTKNEVKKDLDAALADSSDPDSRLQEGYMRGLLDNLSELKYAIPEVTFEQSMAFHGSKRNVEAITYGGGHTISDALLFLPEERIAFLGDLLFVGCHLYLPDGDPGELLRILDKIAALDSKTLVPGHGPVGSPADIVANREYVIRLEKMVDDASASGEASIERRKKPILAPYDGWKWRMFYGDNLEFLWEKDKASK